MNRTREGRTHRDRTPAVAGRFYPGEPDQLALDVAAGVVVAGAVLAQLTVNTISASNIVPSTQANFFIDTLLLVFPFASIINNVYLTKTKWNASNSIPLNYFIETIRKSTP